MAGSGEHDLHEHEMEFRDIETLIASLPNYSGEELSQRVNQAIRLLSDLKKHIRDGVSGYVFPIRSFAFRMMNLATRFQQDIYSYWGPEVQRLREVIKDLSDQVIGLTDSNNDLSSQVDQLARSNNSLKDKVDRLEKEVAEIPALKQEVATLTASKITLEAQVTELTSSNRELQDQAKAREALIKLSELARDVFEPVFDKIIDTDYSDQDVDYEYFYQQVRDGIALETRLSNRVFKSDALVRKNIETIDKTAKEFGLSWKSLRMLYTLRSDRNEEAHEKPRSEAHAKELASYLKSSSESLFLQEILPFIYHKPQQKK